MLLVPEPDRICLRLVLLCLWCVEHGAAAVSIWQLDGWHPGVALDRRVTLLV